VETTPLSTVQSALRRVIRGKDEVIERLLLAVLARGHVLIEDVPGVGKTTLAKALARSFDMDFARVQFTPDLLPTDILGCQVLNPSDGTFAFQAGPIFTTIFLADEINRASPRTQSALLEAMNEEQVTVEGTSRRLPEPFTVIATQNPVDFAGTYPLPEAQLDRFLIRLELGYPDETDELHVLSDRQRADPLADLRPVATRRELLDLQARVRDIEVRESVQRYLLAIVRATRRRPDLALGVSPRGSLGLFRAAQARALLAGRHYVTPDDVHALAIPVLAHRLLPTEDAAFGGARPQAVLAQILEETAVPT
jgi:MoxR-like ATPase